MSKDRSDGKIKAAGNSGKAKARRLERAERARERQAEYDKLGTKDKLARLEERPGESKRERERLSNRSGELEPEDRS